MSATFTVSLVCDGRRSADCWKERTRDYDTPLTLEYLNFDLWKEGWVRGWRPRGGLHGPSQLGDTLEPWDLCPACWRLVDPEEAPEGLRS